MIYSYKDGRSFPVPAQTAGERLEAIRDKAGTLTTEAVVSDARKASSPLHKCFEWNDTSAAQKYRQHQARELIGALVVIPVDRPDAPQVRAFVAVEIGKGNEPHDYQSIEVVMADVTKRKKLLREAFRDLATWQKKYAELTELAAIFETVEQVKEGVAA